MSALIGQYMRYLVTVGTRSPTWQTKNKALFTGYTRLFEYALRFKAVDIGAIALFASRNIMSCL